MGVTGLWRLIEPVGKPVPVETLENKILAVDISIWLHQMVKGYQDAKGAPLPNAHLIGLFQRLCKLLYFRIKPVFVFDGAFPDLKKETIAKRQDNKSKYHSESERLKRELVLLLGKKNMISNLLGKQISPKKGKPSYDVNNDDMFKLPALPRKNEESESESDEEQSSRPAVDLHSLDIESENFNNLPTKEKYELLLELKETRKQNSWGKLHELPKKSDNFSNFQMQRLLKRRKVQECIEETEKEIGGNCMSLNELESLLNEEGIDTKFENLPTRRIASNNTTRFLLINNVKQALADAKKRKEAENQPGPSIDQIKESETIETDPKDQEEDELQKAIKMSLENVDEHETSACTSKTDDSWTSFDVIESEDHNSNSDSEEADDFELAEHLSMAKDYIKQYSDFTYNTINKIVHTEKSTKNKKKLNTDQVLEELNQEKSVILDKLEITSSDEDVLGADEVKYHKIAMKNKKSDYEIDSSNKNTQTTHILEMSEESVVCIEDSSPGIITVDTTLDEDRISNTDVVHEPVKISEDAKESSEDEFEEVPQAETDTPVIQLTLNVNDVVDEDDIFADIFNKSNETYTDRDMKTKIASDIDQTQEIKTVTEIAQVKDVKTVADIECVKEFSQSSGVDQEQFNALKTHRNTLNDNNTTVMNDNNTSVMETQKDKNTSYSNLKSAEHEDEILKDVGKDTKVENEETEQSRKEYTKPRKQLITKEKLNSMIEEIQDNERDIRQETGRLDRIGRNITEEMTREAQELLRIFGVPYIVAPTEAEAQCAFLESVKLTDGTITDDSDIWLFGGRTVYKNFFNQNKNVMQFLAERIEGSYNLTREQLILFALLVGSDYTTGVNGVGPVTALEILASFPFNKRELKEGMENRHVEIITGLKEFKQWMRAGRKTDNLNLKKKLKNVNISDDFPSIRVVQAYLEPNVEKSEEKFTWGELNITVLRDYTKAKFGWSQSKLDEIIKPVLKRKLDRTSQRKVHDYFQRQIEFHSLEEQMTKRVKVAVQRMRPEIGEGSSSENKEAKPTKRKVLKVGENNKSNEGAKAAKLKKQNEESIIRDSTVRVLTTVTSDGKSTIEINIPKSDRIQEIIPQREKDKQELLKNKLKAIELFRKTKIDRKKKLIKRKVITPKDKADLSESSDSE